MRLSCVCFLTVSGSSLDFNLHSRKGSDALQGQLRLFAYISIHTPARGVTATLIQCSPQFRQFNPHSRKGSDICQNHLPVHRIISIHTPARRVTLRGLRGTRLAAISIHTPARGVTILYFPHKYCIFYFNPHSRKGSDLSVTHNQLVCMISIHTPARGVTQNKEVKENGSRFQSTLPQGE